LRQQLVACSLHGVAATIGAMRGRLQPELEVARALIARVKAAGPSIKQVDELLVCAAVASRMSGRRAWRRARLCARTMGKNISRPKQVTDWVARLEKLEQSPAQRSPTAACSCSQLGSGSRRMCQTFAPPIRWSGKSRPASVRFTAYLRQTEAGIARALIARLKAAEFLALRGGC
jgi:hypothetical protein